MRFDPEIWGTVADWVVVATAIAAVWFGREQLQRVVEESARQADVARADLMLQIDQIFEGPEVGASRMAIRTLRNECEAEVKRNDPALAPLESVERSRPIFSGRVTALYLAYKSPPDDKVAPSKMTSRGGKTSAPSHVVAGRDYMELMTLPYWMETVGLLTRKNLLNKDDVLDLYDAVYVGTLTCFDDHLDARRDENDPDRRFLINATWLRDEAVARNERMVAAPKRSAG